MTVVVTANFEAKQGKQEDLVDALKASLPAVHAEPGCIKYALHFTESGAPVLVEKWESVDLLESHLSGEPVAALVARIRPYLAADPVVVRLTPVAAGDEGRGLL